MHMAACAYIMAGGTYVICRTCPGAAQPVPVDWGQAEAGSWGASRSSGRGDVRDAATYGSALCGRMPAHLGITWPPGP